MIESIKTLTVPGKDAVARLETLRQDFVHTGLYPVLLGDSEEVEIYLEGVEDDFDVRELVSDSSSIDAKAWFREALSELESHEEIEDDAEDEWPDEVVKPSGLTIPNDILTGQPKPEIMIALLNLKQPWEAFAVLNWGGWNACPRASEHCAIHKYWHEKYGAEVVGMSADVVECIVTKPPLTREESLELAMEQYAYCPDIVEQGVETISNLAATLMASRYWYFWWD
jgi:hypothetical protein